MIKDLKSICYKKFFLWYNEFIFVEGVDVYATGGFLSEKCIVCQKT